MTWTRRLLRQRIGEPAYCGDAIISTVTANASSNTTVIDTTLMHTDDAFMAGSIYLTSGTYENSERTVIDWTQATGTFTVDRAFGGNVAINTTYEIHRRFSAARKNQAINEAVLNSKYIWERNVEDTSLAFIADTYTYSLANLSVGVDYIVGVDKVEYDPQSTGTGYNFTELSPDEWRVRRASDGTLTLQLTEDYVPDPGATIRLTYRARPRVFNADTGANVNSTVGTLDNDTEAFAAYVCARASAILFQQDSILGDEKSRGKSLEKAAMFQAMADAYTQDSEQKSPGKVIYPGGYARRNLTILGGSQDRIRI